MTSIRITALIALAMAGASGCMATSPSQIEDGDEHVASMEEALARGGSAHGAAFSCTDGECTCSKAVENDCEDMSGVCSDASVDALINCINGWLTTHCTCTQAIVAPKPTLKAPIGTFRTAKGF